MGGLASLWLVWVFVGNLGGLAGLWMVCGWFGWFVGSLAGLWVVWLICGWFRVLQLTIPRDKLRIVEVSKTFIHHFLIFMYFEIYSD